MHASMHSHSGGGHFAHSGSSRSGGRHFAGQRSRDGHRFAMNNQRSNRGGLRRGHERASYVPRLNGERREAREGDRTGTRTGTSGGGTGSRTGTRSGTGMAPGSGSTTGTSGSSTERADTDRDKNK
jgi:hypothetical protein